VLAPGVRVSFEFLPLRDGQFEAMEKGRLDLVVADDGYAPTHFVKEVIFEVDFVCVVAKESRFSRALTLKQYLAAHHIGISILGGIQTIAEKRLAAIGAKRRGTFMAAGARYVPNTQLLSIPFRSELIHSAT
jgi:hypothetical protein